MSTRVRSPLYISAEGASIDEIRQLLARLHPKTDVIPLHRNDERGLPSPVYLTDGTETEFPEKPEPYFHMNGFRRCNYVSDFRDLWTIPMSMEMTGKFLLAGNTFNVL